MGKNIMDLYCKAYGIESTPRTDSSQLELEFKAKNRKKAALVSELETFIKAANLYTRGIQELKFLYFRFSGIEVIKRSDFLVNFEFQPLLVEDGKRAFTYKEVTDYIRKLKMTIKGLDRESTQLYLKMKEKKSLLVKVNATIELLESRLEALKELKTTLETKED